jgi:hypothetical protein
VRKFFRQYLPLLHLKDDEKIAIVSHSAFLSSLSAKGYDEKNEDVIAPAVMHNCQFVPWETFDLN